MADDDTEQQGTETAAPSNAELDQRVSALDSKLDMILDKLSGTRDQAHATAQAHAEDRLDRPSTIAEEIRQQLEAQRAADAEATEKRSSADRLAVVEQTLSAMQEKTPETPPRRAEKIMGWR